MRSLGDAGPYRPLEEAGQDDTGTRYTATAASGDPVMITVVHPHLAARDGFRDRWRADLADLADHLAAAGTAAVVGSDADAPAPWVATELTPGVPLRTVTDLEHGLLLTDDAALMLAGAVARVLRRLHGANRVHGALTPDTIRLTPDGPVVVDTGIARAAGGHHPADDIHALGALLAAAVSGPDPVSPGRLDPRVRRVVAACTRPDPARRPTAAAVTRMIDIGAVDWPEIVRRLAPGDPVLDPPAPPPAPAPPAPAAAPTRPARTTADGFLACSIAVLVAALVGLVMRGGRHLDMTEARAEAGPFFHYMWPTSGLAAGLTCAVVIVLVAKPRTALVPWLVTGGLSLAPFALAALSTTGVEVEILAKSEPFLRHIWTEVFPALLIGGTYLAAKRLHPTSGWPTTVTSLAFSAAVSPCVVVSLYLDWLSIVVGDMVRINALGLLAGALAGSAAWRHLAR
jgi:hypothetical protein